MCWFACLFDCLFVWVYVLFAKVCFVCLNVCDKVCLIISFKILSLLVCLRCLFCFGVLFLYCLLPGGIRIWQSPTAFVDGIIWQWQQKLEAAEFQQMIRVVDCFASGWTDDAHEMNWLTNTLQACVGAGCTPLMQITDTALAKPAKDAMRAEKEKLREELILKAQQENVEAKLVCKEPEILRVAVAMHEAMLQLNEKTEVVLKEARKTGWLSYRPFNKKLMKAEGQRWTAKMLEGSYKLDDTYWQHRYNGLDPDGRPVLPDKTNPSLPLAAGDLQLDPFEDAEQAAQLFLFSCICLLIN